MGHGGGAGREGQGLGAAISLLSPTECPALPGPPVLTAGSLTGAPGAGLQRSGSWVPTALCPRPPTGSPKALASLEGWPGEQGHVGEISCPVDTPDTWGQRTGSRPGEQAGDAGRCPGTVTNDQRLGQPPEAGFPSPSGLVRRPHLSSCPGSPRGLAWGPPAGCSHGPGSLGPPHKSRWPLGQAGGT